MHPFNIWHDDSQTSNRRVESNSGGMGLYQRLLWGGGASGIAYDYNAANLTTTKDEEVEGGQKEEMG
jgi:hypothetical protein